MHILLLIIGLLAALLILGCAYQFVATRRDRLRYASRGRWIEIGNRQSLFVVERGSGSTTVVFESGIAATHLNWCTIQEEVSQFGCAVGYDRCGLGWSSPARTERTPANVASELHRMLEGAHIYPPYVLVGHSFGGMVMRRFALLYPDQVAGVVLVDPMRCCEWPPINAGQQATLNRAIRWLRYAVPVAHIGLARLAVTSALCGSGFLARRMANAAGDGGRHVLGRVTGELAKMPGEIRPRIAAHWSRPDFYKGMRRHIQAVPETVVEMCNADPIERIPVLVLTPGQSTPLDDEEINRIGSNVKQVIAAESGHWVHLDQPDLVVQSIFEMVMAHDPQAVS
ncbi:MAG TPA: alpha/beta hydrolase [Terracidiphilus sp.]|nr:alpha/beta hydrolase [Terracidiphilus sp.]